MVARPGIIQQSFASGEFSPDAFGRTDVKSYYSGASAMLNVASVPQGGFRLHPRSLHVGLAGRNMAQQGSAVLGAPTGAIGAGTVILTYDAGATLALAGADLAGLTSDAAVDAAVILEWQDTGGAWHQLSGAFPAGTNAPSWRACLPPGQPVQSRVIRARVNPALAGTVNVTALELKFFTEIGTLTSRGFPFSYSRTESYDVIINEGHADIWRDGAFVGAAFIPFTADQIADITDTQRADTMFLWHEDVPTVQLKREGADHLWLESQAAFVNIPDVDYGGVYTPVAEQWNLYLSWNYSPFSIADSSFTMTVDGDETEPVTITAESEASYDAAGVALQAALVALPGLGPGITVTRLTYGAGHLSFEVDMTGDANTGQNYLTSARFVSTGQAAATTGLKTKGVAGGEPLISATRGYPACGIFYQDRLFAGGFRSKGTAFIASRSGEYYDWNTLISATSGALLINTDADGAETIIAFVQARHLSFFTEDANYFISDRTIARGTSPNIVRSSSDGAARGIRICESEGQLIFVNRQRSMVLGSTYSEILQAYDPQPFSLLASHLLGDVRAAALKRADSVSDANTYAMVRDDGLMVLAALIRNQDVNAFTRWGTDGLVRDVWVNGANVMNILVERTVDGAPQLSFEQLDSSVFLDGAVTQTFGTPQTVIPNLAMHEGATVWAVVDGYVEGPFTVAGGAITVPTAGSTVTVGRWTPPVATTLPLVQDFGQGKQVLKRPGRVHTARLELIDTTSIAVGANGQPARDQPLYRAGDAVDAPLAPHSGQLVVTGLRGFSYEAQLTITQTRPGWLHVRDVTMEARL